MNPRPGRPTNISRFDGEIVIITDAANGIGREIAARFAAEGGMPVIADLNPDAVQATADALKAEHGDAFAVENPPAKVESPKVFGEGKTKWES